MATTTAETAVTTVGTAAETAAEGTAAEGTAAAGSHASP
jgi:hypothetical protein